jgi:hypothetical protein
MIAVCWHMFGPQQGFMNLYFHRCIPECLRAVLQEHFASSYTV